MLIAFTLVFTGVGITKSEGALPAVKTVNNVSAASETAYACTTTQS